MTESSRRLLSPTVNSNVIRACSLLPGGSGGGGHAGACMAGALGNAVVGAAVVGDAVVGAAVVGAAVVGGAVVLVAAVGDAVIGDAVVGGGGVGGTAFAEKSRRQCCGITPSSVAHASAESSDNARPEVPRGGHSPRWAWQHCDSHEDKKVHEPSSSCAPGS